MKCLLTHYSKGKIPLVDVEDTNLHVLLVLDGITMIDVVEILIIEDTFDEGLGFDYFELVFVEVFG